MARRKVRKDAWYCTDEVCAFFSVPSNFRKRKLKLKTPTGRKRGTWNVTDAARVAVANVNREFGSGALSATDHSKDFKNKTVTASRSKFKSKCKKKAADGQTPLGYGVAVNPTQKEAMRQQREGDIDGVMRKATGGIGHAFAVNCDGDVVADTAPGYHKGKKVKTVKMFAIRGGFDKEAFDRFREKNWVGKDDYIAVW